ncbi:MAG: nitrate reductase [Lentisphaeraceae bacterium]|nr:nitrate reductase [Lentisphaeraceae bacterium]
MSESTTLKSKISNLIRQWEGPLTRELLLEPGSFGLGKVPEKQKPDATTTVVCGFCSTGCGLNLHLKDGQAVNLTPDTGYHVNLGMACPKGWEALAPLRANDRATKPYVKNSSGKLVPTNWHDAMTKMVTNFKSIQEKHGDESVAFLGTGQIVTEELAFLGALTKFGMNMLHGDGNTRQCMATAVVSYKQSFGFDAPPYTYKDFEESDTMIFVGANPCIAHPIMWERVHLNKNNPEIIVVDPRKTETAVAATQHYPIKPKSDLAFFYGIANQLVEKGCVNKDYVDKYTTGFEGYLEHIRTFTPEVVEQESGITIEEQAKLVDTIAKGKKVSFWWTMGVNQSHEGVRVAQSMINIALMTGNFGRPGTGANSITGQCNAMGSRLFSNTTNLLGGHDFANPEDREKIANILEIDVKHIPDKLGWAYDQIVEGISQGKIKGLWVIATNSAHSWINQKGFKDVIKNLDYLVVQDMYHTTETAVLADLILPAAAWAEKDGIFVNSERRLGLVKKVSKAPGEALSDFNIFRLVAEYWGCGEMFSKWTSPEAVFQMLKECSKGQPCDITGIKDYQMLDDRGGIQWPLPAGTEKFDDERRMFEDGKFFHADGKAKFLYEDPRKPLESPCREYDHWLLTGRGTSSQWHTQTRTKKSAVLRKLYPQDPYVEINASEARKMQIEASEWVWVISRRGKIKARACPCYHVRPGQLFMAMHYEETNVLTFPSFDKYSRQPSYKACAVKIKKEEYWE